MERSADRSADKVGPRDRADDLVDVRLHHFTASATSIGPFDSSTLSWSVSRPAGVRVELNNVPVDRAGTRIVRPATTATYRLQAIAGNARMQLKTITVTVDTSSCEAALGTAGFRKLIAPFVIQSLVSASTLPGQYPRLAVRTERIREGLEWRDVPVEQEIWFTPLTLHLALHLSIRAAIRIALDVTLELGLTVDENGSVKPVSPAVSVALDGGLQLQIAGLFHDFKIDEQERALEMDFQPVFTGIADLIAAFHRVDPVTHQFRQIQIPGDPADPPIVVVACLR